jgi:hypothetical protein
MQERALGTIESNFVLLHDHFGGSYTSAVAAKIRGPLGRDVARAALEALVERHPLLRARIVSRPDDETPHFVVHDRAWNVVMGEWTAEDDDGLEEMVAPFVDRDAPLWRCRLLSKGDEHLFVFAAHHAISDALSLTYLLKAFLGEAAKLLRGEAVDATPRPLLPPVESLAEATRAMKRDWGQTLRTAVAHLGGRSALKYAPGSPRLASRTGIESVVLDEDRTAAILAACRAHKTPTTGLLVSALCQAAQEVFGTRGDFLVACPMSCRSLSRTVRLDDSTFGSFTRVGYVSVTPEPLWSRATRVSQQLEELSKAATFSQNPGYRGAERAFRLWSKLPRRGFTDLAVSNLGIVDFRQDAFGPLSVEWLRLGANLAGAFEMLLLASVVFQKRLGLNLAFPEPHTSRPKALATLDALQRILSREGSQS